MTPRQFKRIRRALGLSFEGMARALNLSDDRHLREYAKGKRDVTGPVSVALRYFMKFGLPEEIEDLEPDDDQSPC